MPLLSFLKRLRGLKHRIYLPNMSRRSSSPAGVPSTKRRKLEYPPLTPEDYKNGVMLAPMVRSGARRFTIAQLLRSMLMF